MFAFNFDLRRYIKLSSSRVAEFCASTAMQVLGGAGQGLTLVHFSAQPEPFLGTEATSSVHFSTRPETFVRMKPPRIAHKTAHVKPKSERM